MEVTTLQRIKPQMFKLLFQKYLQYHTLSVPIYIRFSDSPQDIKEDASKGRYSKWSHCLNRPSFNPDLR